MVRIIDQQTLQLQTLQDYMIVANTAQDYKMSLENFIEVIKTKLELSIPSGIGVTVNAQDYSDAQLDNARNIHVDLVRFDLKWIVVEQEADVYDWDIYDTFIEKLENRGLIPFAILDYNNTIAPYNASTELSGISNATQQAGYAAFAAAAADRYKDKTMVFEIWNEPNLDVFWAPTHDVDAYCDLVKATVPLMRAVDPYCLIVGPAVAFVGSTPAFLASCGTNGIFDLLDACSVHPYEDQEPELGGWEYIWGMCMNEIKGSTKPDIPVISSEQGYSYFQTVVGDDEGVKKNLLARKVLYQMRNSETWHYQTEAAAYVYGEAQTPLQIIYSLWNSDDYAVSQLPHNGFGLFDYEGNVLDAGTFLSWVLYNLRGYSFAIDVSEHLNCIPYGPFRDNGAYSWTGVGSATWLKVAKESGTFNLSSIKITGPADITEAPKDFTIKDESDSVLETFTSETFTANEEKEFSVVGSNISAVKIDITDNNGAYNTRIANVELMDSTTSLVPEKTKDDGSGSGDSSGWTTSAKDYTKGDYHLKFIDAFGGVKYWSWTTGDSHWKTFDGNNVYIYDTPVLTQSGTPVTTTGDQSIAGAKTFTGTVKIDSASGGTLEGQPETIIIPVVLLNDVVVAGVSEAFYTCPYNFTITSIRATLAQAQATGNILTIDVNKGGVSILTTVITIDNTEKTSETAATPVVIDNTKVTFADGDEITVDVDQLGDGTAHGLYIQLIGYRTTS